MGETLRPIASFTNTSGMICPRDMECHTDELGNVYDFAFGLNWSGVIDDNRVKTYK